MLFRSRGVVTGLIRLGKGQVVIDQFAVPRDGDGAAKRLRLLRPGRRLRANLGVMPAQDLLAGERTAGAPAASRGYPERLRVRAGALAAGELARLLADCAYSPERMLSTPILGRGAWETVAGSDGSFACGAGERWLYLVIGSPVARQNLATNLGVPNPEALTFCDAEGRVVARGQAHEVITPEQIRSAYRADILVMAHPQTGRPVVVPEVWT